MDKESYMGGGFAMQGREGTWSDGGEVQREGLGEGHRFWDWSLHSANVSSLLAAMLLLLPEEGGAGWWLEATPGGRPALRAICNINV